MSLGNMQDGAWDGAALLGNTVADPGVGVTLHGRKEPIGQTLRGEIPSQPGGGVPAPLDTRGVTACGLQYGHSVMQGIVVQRSEWGAVGRAQALLDGGLRDDITKWGHTETHSVEGVALDGSEGAVFVAVGAVLPIEGG